MTNTTAKIRATVIGTGMIAAVHIRSARIAGAEVVGILGRNRERSAEAARQFSIPRAYASLEELLADRPDVVHVCTPNDQHYPQALATIHAGVHVICEKPLAMDCAQASELAATAEEAGIVATVPFVYRFHPLIREIRSRVKEGELGRVLAMHGSYLQDWMLDEDSSNWRVDSGPGGASRAFADIGSHWCDLVEFVLGEQFVSVSAAMDIVHPTRPLPQGPTFAGRPSDEFELRRLPVTTEDVAVATFRTANARLGNVVISQVSAGRKNRLWFEIDGTRASASFDQENPESVWLGTQDGGQIIVRDPSRGSADQRRLGVVPSGHPQGYLDAFAAFIADTYSAIRGGDPEGLPTFADGARSAQVVEAVLASARSQRWKDIGLAAKDLEQSAPYARARP